MTLDLTIVIPVKNEGKNLQKCISAIGSKLAREIVVIDSNSMDKTKEIALSAGVKYINFDWNGEFPKKRNWYLLKFTPTTKWVFFLDADEILTTHFKNELIQKLTTDSSYVGFYLNYTIYFLGRKLKGGYPLKKIALFQTNSGRYEAIQENNWSNLDMEVHEHPIINGKIGIIRSKIDHEDFRGFESYISKHSDYAKWESMRYLSLTRSQYINSNWSWKQKLKYRLLASIWMGPIYFFGSLFYYRGILDGYLGIAFALTKMSYFNQIHCFIKEQKIAKENQNK